MTEQFFSIYEEGISVLKKRDKKLAWLIERIGNISHTDTKDDFLFFVEQIVGQMLSMKVANVICDGNKRKSIGASHYDT